MLYILNMGRGMLIVVGMRSVRRALLQSYIHLETAQDFTIFPPLLVDVVHIFSLLRRQSTRDKQYELKSSSSQQDDEVSQNNSVVEVDALQPKASRKLDSVTLGSLHKLV